MTVGRLLVLVLALAAVPSAGAWSFTVVTSGQVTLPAVTLNGDDQAQTFAVDVQVDDKIHGKGCCNGWRIEASATTLRGPAGTLPPIVVTDGAASTCSGHKCVDPANTVTWPVGLTATPTPIFDAQAATGTGTTVVTSTYQVTYPASALPGTYSGTLSITAVNSP